MLLGHTLGGAGGGGFLLLVTREANVAEKLKVCYGNFVVFALKKRGELFFNNFKERKVEIVPTVAPRLH